ncbi:hypothetical protein B0H13DRAFT_1852173 [Mycena leptocephala]|nr:hypothetical protein B0H13DRAFT_1852173 [Mycena leptocephala]
MEYATAASKKNEEAFKLYLEEEDSLLHQIDSIISESMQDFPEEDDIDHAVKYAAEIARAVTTDTTRGGHLRIVKHYIASNMRKDPDRDAKSVTTGAEWKKMLP